MDYFLNILTLIGIFYILTQGYNLILGYTGMIHVGHIGFMAIGAYTSALLTVDGHSFWFGLIAGLAAAGLAGLLLGLPTVRLRDDYLVAATLGMGEIVRLVLLNERGFTGGSDGLSKIQRPDIFGYELQSQAALLLFVAIMAILIMVAIKKLVSSPYGKILESIREDEMAARSLGKNVEARKLQILVLGAVLAGLSGVLYAHTTQFITPDNFNIERMLFVFLIVVFGGRGTFWGPIVGTTILYSLFESMRFLPFPDHILGPLRWITYAVVLVVVVIVKPQGIMGKKLTRQKL